MKKFLGAFLFVMLFLGCASVSERGFVESGKKVAPDGVTPTHITKIVRYVKVDAAGKKLLDKQGNEILKKVEFHVKGLSPDAVQYVTPADGSASTGGLTVRQTKPGRFKWIPKETVEVGRVDFYFGNGRGSYSRIYEIPEKTWHGVHTVQHEGHEGWLLRAMHALPAGPRRVALLKGLGAPNAPKKKNKIGEVCEVLVYPPLPMRSKEVAGPPPAPNKKKEKKRGEGASQN